MYSYFALAVVNGKLLAVGGYNEDNDQYSDRIHEYNENGRNWKISSCKLPTKRANVSAIGYGNMLIVAGGCDGKAKDDVDAIDFVVQDRWISLPRLPNPSFDLQSVPYINKDVAIWYLTGTQLGLHNSTPTFFVSIKDLFNKQSHVHWLKIKDPPFKFSGAVAFRGHLLTVGGLDIHNQSIDYFHMYLPGTNEWLKVAKLSSSRSRCTCVRVSDSKFFVLNGEDSKDRYSKQVDSYNTSFTLE